MTVKGPWTGVGLSDTSMLFLRSAPASGYEGAPNHTRHSVQLSFELATAAYTMDPDRWTQAGWRDFSMLVNRTLMTGAALNSAGTPLNDLTRATLQTLARFKMSALNPVGQFLGLRQPDEETASLKAIVMLRRQGELMTVAIGFMGTGKQLGDWTPNLRMTPKEGLHEGFLQLEREFEGYLGQMVFPTAASALDRPAMTLADIIEALKAPGSRFRLWMAGHSQGAAVMQVFVDRLLRGGVRPEYLCGIGFASPKVAHPGYARPAGGYPMTHVLNAEDTVPRLGAWQHLGECLVFTPEDADRRRMYGAAAEDPCFREAHRLLQRAESAPEALINGIALLRVLRRQSDVALQRMLGDVEQKPLSDLLNAGEEGMRKLVDSLITRLERGYADVSGEAAAPEAAVDAATQAWEALLKQYGVAAWTRAVKDACMLPHRLYKASGDETPSYRYIVTEGVERLRRRPAFAPNLTATHGTTAAPRPAVRTVYPSWSSGRVYRRAAPRLPQQPELPLPPEPAEDAVPLQPAPAAPTPVRPAPKVPSSVSRYVNAFRLLSATRARKRKK